MKALDVVIHVFAAVVGFGTIVGAEIEASLPVLEYRAPAVETSTFAFQGLPEGIVECTTDSDCAEKNPSVEF
jgi:hypothetical protein